MATYDEIKDLPSHPEKYLIDVRSAEELDKTGVIPCSVNIPLPNLESALNLSTEEFKLVYQKQKPRIDEIIIFSCLRGGRAQKATDLAKSLGFVNSKTYSGSWTEWAEREGL